MKTMTIGKKLMGSFVATLLLTLALGLSSLNSIGRLSDSFDVAVGKTAKKIVLSGAVDNAESDMVASQRGVIEFTFGKVPSAVEKAKQEFESSAQTWAKSLAEIRPMLVTEEGRQSADQLESNLAAWRPIFAEICQLAASGNPDAALKLAVEKTVPIYQSASKAAQRILEIQIGLLEKDRVATADLNSASHWIALTLIGLSLALGIGILFIVRQTTQTLVKASSELAEGAEQVSSAAGQVSGSSQSLAQGASEQAASLEETSASSEEMASMTRKNAENSQQAAAFMNAVSQRVAEANRTLADMTTSMQEIGASSGKISKIIKVIDEIAFQTNILALNAAVEAARAGEAGMGFAVVADEVRNLAQRSAQAAKDTAALIEDSILKSGEGSRKLGEVAGSIQAITEGAGKVKTLVDEVEASSKEQAQGIEQISKAVAQMDEVTQRTAANAEESAAASEELNAQSQALKAVVEQLQALVGAGSGHSTALRQPIAAQRPTAARPIPSTRRLQSGTAAPRKAAPALTGVTAGRAAAFPLDDSEFKEF
jgi:methyl-accepting chemotaxis protein